MEHIKLKCDEKTVTKIHFSAPAFAVADDRECTDRGLSSRSGGVWDPALQRFGQNIS